MPLGTAIAAGAQIIGGILDRKNANREAKRERARQELFAKSGIQWRVEDAKKAGIHPLAALGFQASSPSPVTVGTDFASVGQNIARSIDATRTGRQRVDAVSKTMQDLQLRKMGLENDLLAAQIAQINQAGHPPPFPYENPSVPDLGMARTQSGGLAVVPSEAVKQRIEDNIIYEGQHMIRNQIVPNFTKGAVDSRGRRGWINPLTGTFHPFKKGSFAERFMGRPVRDFFK